MDNPGCMRRCRGTRHLTRVIEQTIEWDATGLDQAIERCSIQILHHDEIEPVRGVDVVNGDDVRMVETGGGLRLLKKAAPPVGGLVSFAQDLDRYLALQSRIHRRVHDAHPTTTQ